MDYKVYIQDLTEIKWLDEKGITNVTGREKLYITWKALHCRKQLQTVFLHGSYIPLYTSAECGCIAYARQYKNEWALVIAPVSISGIINIKKEQLTDLLLLLPDNAPVAWEDVLAGVTIVSEKNIPLQKVCKKFPVALLTGKTKN